MIDKKNRKVGNVRLKNYGVQIAGVKIIYFLRRILSLPLSLVIGSLSRGAIATQPVTVT